MLPKILLQDSNYDEWCEQELLNAYKDAAEYDDFLFGDHDYSYVWLDDNNKKEGQALFFIDTHKYSIKRLAM